MRSKKTVSIKDNQRMKKQAPGKPAQDVAAQGLTESLIDFKYCIIENSENFKLYMYR